MPFLIECPRCHGRKVTGYCPKCNGNGHILGRPCPECNGLRYIPCSECQGSGQVYQTTSIKVYITSKRFNSTPVYITSQHTLGSQPVYITSQRLDSKPVYVLNPEALPTEYR